MAEGHKVQGHKVSGPVGEDAFVEPGERDSVSRLVISFTQMHTFLALVEEGSVTRASHRLGLGHSTVSAHTKLISEEFGQRQFNRFQGGLVFTAAGLEAYNRFRSLMARAGFAIDYFRSGIEKPPAYLGIGMPLGFPGSRLDVAVNRARARLAGRSPELCLLPAYGSAAPAAALAFSYGSEPCAARQALADRWILIRSASNLGWKSEPVPLSALADLSIMVPMLPAPLLGSLAALGDHVHASFEWSNLGINEILAQAAQLQNFCAVIPASLFNPALVGGLFECVPLEASRFDPVVCIDGEGFAEVAAVLGEELAGLLGLPALEAAATAPAHDPERETLSLKHCRSFLALYEEGNVRRAAQRLCIVQPALTVQLHRIEEQLGCTLFTRSYHGLRANDHADRLSALVRPLMAEFAAATRQMRLSVNRESARVRVGLIPALDDESVTAEGFASALDEWTGTYSDSDLQVVEAYSSTLVRWLAAGKIDFALTDRAFPDPGLVFEQLSEDTMVVVVNRGSDMLRPGPVSLDQLARLPLVLPSSRHGLRMLLSQYLRERGLSLQPRIEVDSMAAALSLVKIARYATILPMGSVYKSRDRRRLSIHEIREPRIARRICLARSRSEPLSAAAQSFIAELRAAFARLTAEATPPPLPVLPVPPAAGLPYALPRAS